MPSRPSPSAHAAELEPGTIRRGNDGAHWIVISAGRSQRWVRIPSPPGRAYFTHDNGGRPFKIHVDGADVAVLGLQPDLEGDVYLQMAYRRRGCQRIFVGRDGGRGGLGNSVLLQTGPRAYVFIGERIFSFTASKPITTYHSPIGNSDVPYPWAASDCAVYLMIETVVLPREELGDADPYAWFYELPERQRRRLARPLPGFRKLVERICD